jgi:heme-binding protein
MARWSSVGGPNAFTLAINKESAPMPLLQSAWRFSPRTAVCAVSGAVALSVLAGPTASAAPDPCAASPIARTVAAVATDTGDYLDTHPQTDHALTVIAAQPAGPQSVTALQSYFSANPRAALDMQAIQQPLTGLSSRCKLPISLPQVLGLMQSVQGATVPTPAAAPPAGTTTTPVATPAMPAQSLSGTGLGR